MVVTHKRATAPHASLHSSRQPPFSFPGFWMLHASGFGAHLYRPLQLLFHTSAVGWPSLVSAALCYGAVILCFEICWRLMKNAQP